MYLPDRDYQAVLEVMPKAHIDKLVALLNNYVGLQGKASQQVTALKVIRQHYDVSPDEASSLVARLSRLVFIDADTSDELMALSEAAQRLDAEVERLEGCKPQNLHRLEDLIRRLRGIRSKMLSKLTKDLVDSDVIVLLNGDFDEGEN